MDVRSRSPAFLQIAPCKMFRGFPQKIRNRPMDPGVGFRASLLRCGVGSESLDEGPAWAVLGPSPFLGPIILE